jgi:hypothetical protein
MNMSETYRITVDDDLAKDVSRIAKAMDVEAAEAVKRLLKIGVSRKKALTNYAGSDKPKAKRAAKPKARASKPKAGAKAKAGSKDKPAKARAKIVAPKTNGAAPHPTEGTAAEA